MDSKEVIIQTEAAPQSCSEEKVFWKYAANLQEFDNYGKI